MGNTMKRKQFHMTSEDVKMLRELAESSGLSEAEVVREAVREYAAKKAKKVNPLLIMAKEAEKYQSDTSEDLSENHDLHLLEIREGK